MRKVPAVKKTLLNPTLMQRAVKLRSGFLFDCNGETCYDKQNGHFQLSKATKEILKPTV